MEKFKNLTDEELMSTLRKYGIPHGPIVGTTRTLYEKKLLQYEREKITFPASTSSYESRQQYSGRDFDDHSGSYSSRQQYSRRDFDDDNDSYGSRQHRRRDVDDDNGDSHTYEKEEVVTRTYLYPQSSYRSYSSKDNVYQNISQPRYQSSYSQGVEPRKPIRPKQKEETTPVKRFIPLWLQLLLLLLISAFLVYMYILQTDENPFRSLEGSL